MKPWLRQVSQLFGRFSGRWQNRFGKFIEKKAETLITDAAGNILKKVDLIEEINHPKARFVPELADLYRRAAKPEYMQDDGFDLGEFLDIFSDKLALQRQKRVPIEIKIAELVGALKFARTGNQRGWINRTSYPLIARVSEISGFPSSATNEETAGIVGSEIMSGIGKFLKEQGVREIPRTPRPVKTFDLFDGNTWNGGSMGRSFAETFAWDQVQAVKKTYLQYW